MGDSYIEILVKRRSKAYHALIKGVFLFLTFLLIVLGLMSRSFLFLIFGILFGVATYYINMELDIEYEYLYVNGELTIDKIMGKSKRKSCLTIDMGKIEIVAPEKSWHLSEYENKKCPVTDYSSGEEEKEIYALFYREGNVLAKLLFEPNDTMIQTMRQMGPRKVFSE